MLLYNNTTPDYKWHTFAKLGIETISFLNRKRWKQRKFTIANEVNFVRMILKLKLRVISGHVGKEEMLCITPWLNLNSLFEPV